MLEPICFRFPTYHLLIVVLCGANTVLVCAAFFSAQKIPTIAKGVNGF
jgi:hypothetical protein